MRLLMLLIGLLLGRPLLCVGATQQVVFDWTRKVNATFDQTAYDGTYKALPFQTANLTTPVDYAAGTAHVTVVVTNKPSATPFYWRLAWYPQKSGWHLWGPLLGPITANGTYEGDVVISKMGSTNGPATYDYTQGVYTIQWPTYDAHNNGIAVNPADYPYNIHITVTLLSKGAVYAHPNNYGGLDFDTLTHQPQLVAQVKQGALGQALKLAEAAQSAKDPAAAAEAGQAVAALRKDAAAARAEIEAAKEGDPVAACTALSELAQKYVGSSVGQELTALCRKWQDEPGMVKEREAAAIMAQITAAQKAAQKHGDLKNPAVAKRCQAELDAIAAGARLLKEKYGATSACRQAIALCQSLNIKL